MRNTFMFNIIYICLVIQYIYMCSIKGIVHFEIHFWDVLTYLDGIQDVGVFVSAVVSVLIF